MLGRQKAAHIVQLTQSGVHKHSDTCASGGVGRESEYRVY